MKSLDAFDFAAIPSLNRMLVLELTRCGYILGRKNVIGLGNSGTGKTHIAWLSAWRLARRASRSRSRPRLRWSISSSRLASVVCSEKWPR